MAIGSKKCRGRRQINSMRPLISLDVMISPRHVTESKRRSLRGSREPSQLANGRSRLRLPIFRQFFDDRNGRRTPNVKISTIVRRSACFDLSGSKHLTKYVQRDCSNLGNVQRCVPAFDHANDFPQADVIFIARGDDFLLEFFGVDHGSTLTSVTSILTRGPRISI